MEKTKQPSIKQLEATNKAYKLRNLASNDNELANTLGLSKVTLYTRFRRSNWKNAEILFLELYSNDEFKKFVMSLQILDV